MLSILPDLGSGSGSHLPLPVLALAGLATIIAVTVSTTSICLHLRNYRKPVLQRMVIRIMVMVPLYAIASLISLFSLQAAFFIDAVRDIYEAFVIYCFFDLLISYLGGERALLISLHGRPPKYPVFPTSLFWSEVDVSDPYTFLFLKRGVLQYVQVKPVLALVTIILKAVGKYNEGDLRINSGYLYVSIFYNLSICMSLYCLAIFWMCVNEDLKSFRPMPKFLCVKGILFFSFWQSIFISILVAAGFITHLGPYTDNEHVSLGLTDTLICIEMPLFAIAHQYAFSTRDFVDPHAKYVARMPMYHAFRDAFGLRDVIEDSKATLRGEGMDYREFEPSEGIMHQGAGRDRRIRAGLRYSQGGKRKYWLPQAIPQTRPPGKMERRVNKAIEHVTRQEDQGEEVYAPLLPQQAENVVHLAPDLRSPDNEDDTLFHVFDVADEGYDLPFGDIEEEDEEVFQAAKKLVFGDYNYPCVDISNESARMEVWEEEERILRDERGAYFSPIRGPRNVAGYGATSHAPPMQRSDSNQSSGGSPKGKLKNTDGRHVRHAVVDKDSDKIDSGSGDVHLKWNKLAIPVSPRVRTLSNQSRSGSGSSGSSAVGTPRDHVSPSPRKETERPILLPDAVDLVVEDPSAAEEEMTYERLKGEPAMRGGGGLKKVYRRGYVVEDNDTGRREVGEVEVEPTSPEAGKASEDEDEVDEVTMEEQEAIEAVAEEEGTIVRAETPPAHARVVVDHYRMRSDDNPWA